MIPPQNPVSLYHNPQPRFKKWPTSEPVLSAKDTDQTLRRSGRIPVPTRSTSAPVPKKRKLEFTNDSEAISAPTKKRRLADQKLSSQDIFAKQRDEQNTRRLKFFWTHRNIFEPMLPAGSRVFGSIAQQFKDTSNVHAIPLHQLENQPAMIQGGFMKEYQLQGLSFLSYMYKNGMNCILGDEMGLGKTLQTLSLFAWISENTTGPHAPHLIVCPLSVLSSWQSECKRWVPSMKATRFHGTSNERNAIKHSLKETARDFTKEGHMDIMFTTYEVYLSEESWFKSRRWTMVVLDEGHKIKNAETNIAMRLQGLGSLGRLILTGTPIQNNLVELWSLLHFLYPTVFTPSTSALFENSFNLTKGSYSLEVMDNAKALLDTIMLRRTKDVVEIGIPPREEMDIFLPMLEYQRFWYLRMLTRLDKVNINRVFQKGSDQTTPTTTDEYSAGRQEVLDRINTEEAQGQIGGDGSWRKLMNLLMQLRRVCDHPYLLHNSEPDPWYIGEHIIASSSKLVFIDKLLKEILPNGEKVLIFSQWTGMLDNVEDMLFLRGIRYARLDGSASRPRRALDIRLFQQDDDRIQVYVISTNAGGLGINLTKASTVVMCDSSWNPQMDLQAVARAHRIGQTKKVKVYRLLCQGSVEDQMQDRIRRKLYLSLKIMGSSSSSSASSGVNGVGEDISTSLGGTELLDILRRGTGALASDTEMEGTWGLDDFFKASVDDIKVSSKVVEDARWAKLKNAVAEEEVEEDELKNAEEEEMRLLAGIAQVRSRMWEGNLINNTDNNQTNGDIRKEWEKKEKKRERKDQIVLFNGIEHISRPEEILAIPNQKKPKKPPIEHEDWCMYCRDGGSILGCCLSCPKIFHAGCRGVTKADLTGLGVMCGHHNCVTCERATADAGGMLYRCRTCPQAFCEDCLPEEGLEYVGDSLPEYQILNYPAKGTAYYIRCPECIQYHTKDRRGQKEWKVRQAEFEEAERQLAEQDD